MAARDMPYTTDELIAMLHAHIAADGFARDPMWVDPHELFAGDTRESWLVEDVWPHGRQVHIHAARKTGKSLIALWVACNLAKGIDPFNGREREPVRIAYLDYEMNMDDLRERVMDMRFTEDDLQPTHWYYALNPPLPMMDTQAGGEAVLEKLISANVQAVVFDTFSRIVQGDENSNDTYRAFFRHTGARLKAAGIAMLRLDHEGHKEGVSRGASAKADDVDVVWQLRAADNNAMQLVRKSARMAWVPEYVNLERIEEPLAFRRIGVIIPNGTMDLVDQLDALDVPLTATRTQLRKDYGITARNNVISAAMRVRTNRIIGL